MNSSVNRDVFICTVMMEDFFMVVQVDDPQQYSQVC